MFIPDKAMQDSYLQIYIRNFSSLFLLIFPFLLFLATPPIHVSIVRRKYEIADATLENLTDGIKPFTFTTFWNNGTIKTDVVNVTILNKWDEYFRIHRVK
jgi:hypothetical protein